MTRKEDPEKSRARAQARAKEIRGLWANDEANDADEQFVPEPTAQAQLDTTFIEWLKIAAQTENISLHSGPEAIAVFFSRVGRAWAQYHIDFRSKSPNEVHREMETLHVASHVHKRQPSTKSDMRYHRKYAEAVEKAFKKTERVLINISNETIMFLQSRSMRRHGVLIAQNPSILLRDKVSTEDMADALLKVWSLTNLDTPQPATGRVRRTKDDQRLPSKSKKPCLYAPPLEKNPDRRWAERAFIWRVQIAWALAGGHAPPAAGQGPFFRFLELMLNSAPNRPSKRRIKTSAVMVGFGKAPPAQNASALESRRAAEKEKESAPFGLYMPWHEGPLHFGLAPSGRIAGVFGAGYLILSCDEEDTEGARNRLLIVAHQRVDAEFSAGDVIS